MMLPRLVIALGCAFVSLSAQAEKISRVDIRGLDEAMAENVRVNLSLEDALDKTITPRRLDYLLESAQDEAPLWSEEEGMLAEANRSESASDDLQGSFEALESDAHFDHVLYDAQQFGLHAEVGSEDEQGYLGLPGLFEPDQVHALLSERQTKQSRRTGGKAKEADAPVAAHRALAAQRKELNKLVAAYAKKTGAPHANVHMDLRRSCGGPELAQATSEQVTERIERIRRWFVGRR